MIAVAAKLCMYKTWTSYLLISLQDFHTMAHIFTKVVWSESRSLQGQMFSMSYCGGQWLLQCRLGYSVVLLPISLFVIFFVLSSLMLYVLESFLFWYFSVLYLCGSKLISE